ncbi:hypothetical protein GGI43DRAFT_261572 [Trichoderma evansii]
MAGCLYRLWGLLLMATLRQVNDEQRASRASSGASSICDTRLVFISMELLSGSTTISGMLCGCGSRFGPKVTFEVGSYACNLWRGQSTSTKHDHERAGNRFEWQPALRLLSD